eukprot:973097-Prymnesium_polylepis.2
MVKSSLVLGLAACASAINVGDKIPSISLDYGARTPRFSAPAPFPHCGGFSLCERVRVRAWQASLRRRSTSLIASRARRSSSSACRAPSRPPDPRGRCQATFRIRTP